MSVEAVFQMNFEVDSRLYDELMIKLECMLKVVFPLAPSRSPTRNPNTRSRDSKVRLKLKPQSSSYESIVRGEQELLSDIICQARKLSFMIQREIVSCQLLVTMAPASAMQTSSDGSNAITDDALGTYAFGLQRILGSERSDLIKPEIVTSAAYRMM
jgi:hypothetical protein